MSEAVHFNEFAEKPACQVNEMNALVDQLSASRALRLSSPFACVAESAAMSVARPQVQQGTQYSRVDETSSVLKSSVIPMIEAHTDANVAHGGELRQAKQLIYVSCRRFLDEHVDSGVDCSTRNLDL